MVEASSNGQVIKKNGNKALYILQIKKSKLTEQSMRVLKCLLFHVLRTTGVQHITVEVHFDQTEFFPLEQHLDTILKMLITGYNLTEPEHSRDFPMVAIEILIPQIFSCPSVLLTDNTISHVYYNPETNPDEVYALYNERCADQTMRIPAPPLISIDEIKDEAMVFAVEFVRPGLDFVTQEDDTTPVDNKKKLV